MKKLGLLFFIAIMVSLGYAQVGIGTNNPAEGSILDIKGNGSVLLPRVALTDVTSKSPIIPATSTNTPVAGMMLYNTNASVTGGNGVGIYYWDGAKWVMLALNTGTAPASSIFYKTTTTNDATAVTDNVYHQGAITLGTASGHNVSENGAMLNLEANDKGLLLNRVTLVSSTSPQPLRPNATDSMEEGMVVYHLGSTSMIEGLYFWDGAKWNKLFVDSQGTGGNDGIVKINSGSGTAQVKPSFNLTKSGAGFGTWQRVDYDTSLNYASGTTDWPETVTPVTNMDPYIFNFTTEKFLENPIVGQVHLWRVIIYMNNGTSADGAVRCRLMNPLSGFETASTQLIPGDATTVSFLLMTVADAASIGNGYHLEFQADANIGCYLESVTRVSLFKD